MVPVLEAVAVNVLVKRAGQQAAPMKTNRKNIFVIVVKSWLQSPLLTYHLNGFFQLLRMIFFNLKPDRRRSHWNLLYITEAAFDLTSGRVSRISPDSVKLQSKSLLSSRTRCCSGTKSPPPSPYPSTTPRPSPTSRGPWL